MLVGCEISSTDAPLRETTSPTTSSPASHLMQAELYIQHRNAASLPPPLFSEINIFIYSREKILLGRDCLGGGGGGGNAHVVITHYNSLYLFTTVN